MTTPEPSSLSAEDTALVAEALAEHRRGDWSDWTYCCQGCRQRFETEIEKLDRPIGDDVRRELNRHMKPNWTVEAAMRTEFWWAGWSGVRCWSADAHEEHVWTTRAGVQHACPGLHTPPGHDESPEAGAREESDD